MSVKELEERVLLNKNQFLELEKFIQENYPNFTMTQQVNRYLDDAALTVRNKVNVLRIRSFPKENKRELTYKIGTPNGDIENNQPLTYYWYTQIVRFSRLPEGEVKEKLLADGVNIKSLRTLVELKTIRIEVKLDKYTIVLDENHYNHITDYDLEIESKVSKSHAKEVILEFCDKFGLTYKNDYPVKSRRAFDSLFRRI